MTQRFHRFSTLPALVIILTVLLHCTSLYSAELAKGQTVYIPAYSHIYHGSKETPLLLSVTLSLRNTDMRHPLTLTAVNYYDTKGVLVKEFLEKAIVIGPLSSERFIVPQDDNSGGSGANFIVEWTAQQPINPPVMEAVMIGTQSQLRISFSSRGVEVRK